MSHLRPAPSPETLPGRVIRGSQLASQPIRAGQQLHRVQPGPRLRNSEPVVRVEQSEPARTLLAVTCTCGEVIEIELLHPPGGNDAAKD
jgi:hypothetical protein